MNKRERKERRETVERWIRLGVTRGEIAERLGMKMSGLNTWMRRNGLKGTANPQVRVLAKASNRQKRLIIRRVEAGKTWAEIATELKISTKSLYRLRVRYGMAINKPRQKAGNGGYPPHCFNPRETDCWALSGRA